MKKNNIIRLSIAILGFILLVIAFILLITGAYIKSEQLLYIAFIPLFIGMVLMLYIFVYLIIKFFKDRK